MLATIKKWWKFEVSIAVLLLLVGVGAALGENWYKSHYYTVEEPPAPVVNTEIEELANDLRDLGLPRGALEFLLSMSPAELRRDLVKCTMEMDWQAQNLETWKFKALRAEKSLNGCCSRCGK